MTRKVFLIGNGESRLGFDLSSLRPHGKIYGCNAIYRDFDPDVLIAVDNGMMHMIYHSGYATKVPCYFRNWVKVPAFHYKTMVEGVVNHELLQEMKSKRLIVENQKNNAQEFVMHGANVSGLVKILKNGKPKKKNINQTSVRISWIQEGDKSHNLRDLFKGVDRGWASGAMSGLIAVEKEKPNEVFLIGHDLYSATKTVNNIYKSTKGYALKERSPIPPNNWIKQWKELFKMNRNIQFYKVNRDLKSNDKVNSPIIEWNGSPNIKYIDYTTLDKMLK